MNKQINHLAFVFPGQGSQAVGMLNELAAVYSEIKHTFDRASYVLGFNLWDLVSNGPEESLNKTDITQPAMLAAGVAIWEIWCQHSSFRPAWMAGHSLGEYTALVCAGALFFEDAVKLVGARARFMQEAVPIGQGAMAAVLGLDDDHVIEVCKQASQGEIVSAVNFNAPGQVVIAGQKDAVERAAKLAKENGAKRALMLPVSVPSHCALMRPAADKLEQILEDTAIATPKIKLLHNVDLENHNAPEIIRNALKEQLYKPVRWVETIQAMVDNGVSCFVECGPGKVLTGLNKRIAKNAEHLSIFNPESLEKTLVYIND
jgi:[acyl-carrier-protein] S-malonyltransferase